jgi:hypothetical protein
MKTAPKNLSYKGEIMPLVVAALKELGKDKVSDDVLRVIKKSMQYESKEILLADVYIAPQWITDILLKLIND